MEGDPRDLHSHGLDLFQQLLGKVQARCRRGYAAVVLCVHRLIAVLVLIHRRSVDIRRKRHRTDLLEPLHEDAFVFESNDPRSALTVRVDVGPESVCEVYAVARLQSFARSYHGLPCVAFEPLSKQELHLGSRDRLSSVKPCGKHLRVVDDEAVARLQMLFHVAEMLVTDRACLPVHN